jgi:hypothetical protein
MNRVANALIKKGIKKGDKVIQKKIDFIIVGRVEIIGVIIGPDIRL